MPSGTRPRPPEIKLQALLGLKLSEFRRVLGTPHKWPKGLAPCRSTICLSFTYGPPEIARATPEPVQRADGIMEIQVTTGGPFLLILSVSKGRVIGADWLGQK